MTSRRRPVSSDCRCRPDARTFPAADRSSTWTHAPLGASSGGTASAMVEVRGAMRSAIGALGSPRVGPWSVNVGLAAESAAPGGCAAPGAAGSEPLTETSRSLTGSASDESRPLLDRGMDPGALAGTPARLDPSDRTGAGAPTMTTVKRTASNPIPRRMDGPREWCGRLANGDLTLMYGRASPPRRAPRPAVTCRGRGPALRRGTKKG